ncbi:MAG TPA: acylneuraminate cytidylyltransferase family protein [Thermoanaerobaculia bacterium]|nr:acylneuraminate cytidylyltransferase family protein [Thermoanaerobaculia bacterium]
MRTLGLVPARGGSKGIPRKNLRALAGRPLLEYTARTALAAASLSKVILSTDDEAIAETGRAAGLAVPFLRPAELAEDDTPTLPVVQHALRWLERHGERYDAVCLLQPTSPFRRPATIDGCVALLERSGADSVISVVPVPAEHNPHWVYFRSDDGLLRLSTGEASPIPRRQALPPAWCRDGSVYVVRAQIVLEGGTLYGDRVAGWISEEDDVVNLDEMDDWRRAEAIAARRAGSAG